MHARPRRAPGASAPDDAALAQLSRRVGTNDCSTESTKAVASVWEQSLHAVASAGDLKREAKQSSLAVTTKHALADEAIATELALHQGGSSTAGSESPIVNETLEEICRIPALEELEELTNELYAVHSRSQNDSHSGSDGAEEAEAELLSIQEREYAHALQQAVVATLTHITLSKFSSQNASRSQQNQLPLGDVHVWLLEMVVRPSALSRQLAFALFFNLSVSVTAIVLARTHEAATESKSTRFQAEQMQTRLFQVLVEMLSKAVVVASSSLKEPRTSCSSRSRDRQWIAQAIGCLLLFAKHGGRFRADRLSALDPQILRFFLKELSESDSVQRDGGDLENQLLELLVFTMYAQEAEAVTTGSHPHVRFALPLTALEPFGGLDVLLFHFYTSHSLNTRRLLLMVFFDVACHQQHRVDITTAKNRSSLIEKQLQEESELWHCVQRWDLALYMASAPTLFAAASVARVVKKLCAAVTSPALPQSLAEKQVLQFVNQLRVLMHVDEYFAQSVSLSKTLQLLHDQEKHSVTDALMAKIAQLLASSRMEDKFQAERWLAELVTYGASSGATGNALTAATSNNNAALVAQQRSSDPLSESVIFTGAESDLEANNMSPHNQTSDAADELEETCCFDEDVSIRIAARSKFWELAKSPSAAHRESFARALNVFVKRKLCAKISGGLVVVAREISMCLRVALQQREASQRVLISLLVLILEVSKREVSSKDRQKQKYDQECTAQSREERGLGNWSSDSLASRFLDGEIALDAALLKEASSPLVGDLVATTALIVSHQIVSNQTAQSHDSSSVSALLPLMEACDTRAAVTIAKLVASTLKRCDGEQYVALLRDLHATAVEDDDDAPLTLSHLRAKALVARWVQS